MKVKRSRLYVTVALALLLALVTSAVYARDDIRTLDNHEDETAVSSSDEGSVNPPGVSGGRYGDTSSNTANCNGYECGAGGTVVRNGDFNPALWTNNVPAFWDLWFPQRSGWVSHPASMNMAIVHDTAFEPGENDALALFMRNVGGAGPHNMYATQELTVPVDGYYWVQVHASMFGDFQNGGAGGFHNATAWYGIGKANGDPSSVALWREMFPMTLPNPGQRPCYNSGEHCIQVGRYETVFLEAGDVLYLRAGHKWSTFNVWTVFEFDDISIEPLPETAAKDQSGFWDVGDIGWDDHAGR